MLTYAIDILTCEILSARIVRFFFFWVWKKLFQKFSTQTYKSLFKFIDKNELNLNTSELKKLNITYQNTLRKVNVFFTKR